MPYPGQNEPKELKADDSAAKKVMNVAKAKSETVSTNTTLDTPERKISSQLSRNKLSTSNLGIESILNPKERKNSKDDTVLVENQNERYSPDQFEHAWKEFALGIKREKKDSLFTTLMTCEKTVDSQNVVKMLIHNTIQEAELDVIKGDFVRFLRDKLKNTNIDISYSITEKKSVTVMDSKGTFEKLAEENSSLNKFRKLFNLDIEF